MFRIATEFKKINDLDREIINTAVEERRLDKYKVKET